MWPKPPKGEHRFSKNSPLSHRLYSHLGAAAAQPATARKPHILTPEATIERSIFCDCKTGLMTIKLEREMTSFRTVTEAPFRTTLDGKRVLQCHSHGDRRFSPFCCFVEAFGDKNSIENHYQRAKIFNEKIVPQDWRQAKHFKKSGLKQTHWQIGPYRLPCITNPDGNSFALDDFGIQFYIALWHKYLLSNKSLIAIAAQFDEYEDPFKGSFPFCQADVIRQCVTKGIDSLRPMYAELHSLLKHGLLSPD